MTIFLRRVFSFANKSFWRNLGLSLTTILILVLTLISFNVVLSVNAMTKAALQLVEDRIDISLLFKIDAPIAKIDELRAALGKLPKVSSLIFKSRDEVLADFKTKHAQDSEILSALSELPDNPLGAILIVRAASSQDYEEILSAIDIPEYNNLIEQKTFEDHATIIKKIGAMTNRVQKGAVAISVLLLVIAFLIIFNVIKVAIYTHREEIGVMRLVGASNWFIRAPFLIEVILFNFLAVVLSAILLYAFLQFGDNYVKTFFAGSNFSLLGYFNGNFVRIFVGEFLALSILGVFSGSLAMRKYLKV